MLIVNLDRRITFFNPAAARITGVPMEKAVGSRCSDVFCSEVCETDKCLLNRTIEKGQSLLSLPIFITTAAGSRIAISVSTGIRTDSGGTITGIVKSFRTISLFGRSRSFESLASPFPDIVTSNERMLNILTMLPRIATSDCSVLLEGESGTGKELFAKAIHNSSYRREHPLVSFNCTSVPDTLLDSALFGHMAGSFTGAKSDKPGRFARAEGGTLFLDEIDTLDYDQQVKLLRVLEEKEYEPLGARKPVRADVRIITATNQDLNALKERGKFRKDLYYRINGFRITLPPLRKRTDDIPLLIEHFMELISNKRGLSTPGLSPEAFGLLKGYHYPGNIRELRNFIGTALINCEDGIILPHHFPSELFHSPHKSELPESLSSIKTESVKIAIERALKNNNGNRTTAARELNLHRCTLHKKIKTLNITIPKRIKQHKREVNE